MPGGGPQSAVDGEDEAGRLPTRRHPTPSRGQVPGGGPQSRVDGEDEACIILQYEYKFIRFKNDISLIIGEKVKNDFYCC